MKSLLIAGIFLSLVFAPNVFAQGVGVRVQREEKREERKIKITAAKRERIMSFSNKMTIRLDAVVERLQKLIDRIDARIAKIDASDTDISTKLAKDAVTEAKTNLASAKEEITIFKASLTSIPEADDAKMAFKETKVSLDSIKNKLKAVHSALVKSIGEIKGLRIGATNEK